MADTSQTPLAHVMDLLGISGTSLAKSIHVHQSMVSRWKSGATEFTNNTRYFEDIVQALQAIDKKQGRDTLQLFLSSIYGEPMQRKDDVYKYLVMWLTGTNFDIPEEMRNKNHRNSLYAAEHYVYKGRLGRTSAAQFFLDTLAALPPEQAVWEYEDESNRIFIDGASGKKFQQQLVALAKRGTTFNVLTHLNRSREQIFELYKYWLPVCTVNGTQIMFTYEASPSLFSGIHYIFGRLAMLSTDSQSDDPNQYTAIFEDPLTVKQIDLHLRKLQESFKPLLKYLRNKDKYHDFTDAGIEAYTRHGNNQYTFLEEFLLLTFDKELSEEITQLIGEDPAEEKLLAKYFRQNMQFTNKYLSEGTHTHIVISNSLLDRLEVGGEIEVPVLSAYLGREIKLPVKYLKKDLETCLALPTTNPSIEVAIQPKSSPDFMEGINIWVKENAFVYCHPSKNMSTRVVVDEFSSVLAFYSTAAQYWNTLPYESKNPEFTMCQLDYVDNAK